MVNAGHHPMAAAATAAATTRRASSSTTGSVADALPLSLIGSLPLRSGWPQTPAVLRQLVAKGRKREMSFAVRGNLLGVPYFGYVP
jgi:hypothetical protein